MCSKKKNDAVVSKAKRPREQSAIKTDSGSSKLVNAKQAVAADPDDAECKALYERKKQRLEQLESERATPFDMQEKLKAFGEKFDKKRKCTESVDEKVRKFQDESERAHHKFAEMEDQANGATATERRQNSSRVSNRSLCKRIRCINRFQVGKNCADFKR